MLRAMTKKNLPEQSNPIFVGCFRFLFLFFFVSSQRQVAEGEKDLNIICTIDI